jgi:hypothetical protein
MSPLAFFGLPFYLKEIAAFLVQWGSLFPLNQCPGREEKGTSRIHTYGDRPFR